jgi:hypothetical protein
MAQGLKVGDMVYIPRARHGLSVDEPSAFYRAAVRDTADRSIEVDMPDGTTGWVASSAAHLNIGVFILRIGDFDTETTLLDPLTKSLLQYCRLLLPDDMVVLREVRSRGELRHFWERDHAAYSHLIVLGHGRKDAIRFGREDWASAENFTAALAVPNVRSKVIVSLGCNNGYAAFGQHLSTHEVSQVLIAPFQSVHGAVASQFCQTFLAYHLLQGETIAVAFRHARGSVPGATSFRLWVKGRLKAGT